MYSRANTYDVESLKMSMVSITAGSELRASPLRQAGFFTRLAAAARISRAIQNNGRADRRDLEILGITNSFTRYQDHRDAVRD